MLRSPVELPPDLLCFGSSRLLALTRDVRSHGAEGTVRADHPRTGAFVRPVRSSVLRDGSELVPSHGWRRDARADPLDRSRLCRLRHSAFIMSLFVRLVIRFMRKSLERECRYMRGDHTDFGTKRAPNTAPRNW
jgi:hypothetical protein